MCLLVVCSPGSIPSRADLERGACANPHGYGFAMVVGGKIHRYRTMSRKKAVSKFLDMRTQYPEGYAIWHARYATHGVKNEANCHPFQVGDDEDTVLAHNGVLDTHIESGDRRSDTRIFAEDTLPRLGGVTALDDENIYIMVSKWARGSKIAVLTVNPNAKHQCYLLNEQDGDWDDAGIWWSNESYKPYEKKSYSSYGAVWTKATDYKPTPPAGTNYAYDDVWDAFVDEQGTLLAECPNCMVLSTYDDVTCEHCTLCYDCSMAKDECLCYIPSKERYVNY